MWWRARSLQNAKKWRSPSVLMWLILYRSKSGVCLFRVLQEALHNAIKHSTMKRVNVHMAEK